MHLTGMTIIILITILATAGGIGGGGITTPLMMFFFKLSIKECVPIAAFCGLVSTLVRFIMNYN